MNAIHQSANSNDYRSPAGHVNKRKMPDGEGLLYWGHGQAGTRAS